MALEFTNIPDRTGPAVYLVGDGSGEQHRQLEDLGAAIDAATPEETQVVYLDSTNGDGLNVKEFYALMDFPTVMIVMDDDTLYQSWTNDLPQPDQVAYYLSQVGGQMG